MMARLDDKPTPEVVVVLPVRGLFAVALENAVEGCVNEAFSAVVVGAQARALTGEIAATLAAIAADECAHADVAWDVAAWLEARLGPSQRAAVQAARQAALVALPMAARADRGDGAALFAMPDADVRAGLARHFAAAIAATAQLAA